MHVLSGQLVDDELMFDICAGLTAANKQAADNPCNAMVGIGARRRPTEEIMRETRGDGSMR